MIRYPLCLVVALGGSAAAQVTAGGAPAPARAPARAAVYRGFEPGVRYREFATRARALARRDPLVCNTSKHTAQLMECGVLIRDPADSATFYLSAHVIGGRVSMISFTDSGGAPLVERVKQDLIRRFGKAQRTEIGMWEWKPAGGGGRKVVRFSWRGRGSARWVSITLTDQDVIDEIRRYVKRTP
ncbi:MAG: hypothetical protein ACREL9_10845 [Gemmatimonadales bacterium]